MRVLMVNNHHQLKGGSERVYFETAQLMASRGHEVFYFSSSPSLSDSSNAFFVPQATMPGEGMVGNIRRAFQFIYSSQAARKLDEVIAAVRPDIAHLHIFYGHLTSSILPVFRRHQVPVVMSVHEYRLLCPCYTLFDTSSRVCCDCASGNYLPSIQKKCVKGSAPYSVVAAAECYVRDRFFPYGKYVAKFIMVSEFCRQIHVRYKPDLAEKSMKLFNFIDLSQCSEARSNDGYFLYLGRLSREKGLITLLDAFSMLPAVRLKIAGDGEMRTNVQAVCSTSSNIEYCGFKSGEELKALITGAKAICVPSEWYENNPMSVIESFGYGKPVIGARIGGIPELVIDGETGLLFEPGNVLSLREAVLRFERLSTPAYEAMCKSARTFVELNNNPEDHYNVLMNVYREAMR